jgi:hypothetical protein
MGRPGARFDAGVGGECGVRSVLRLGPWFFGGGALRKSTLLSTPRLLALVSFLRTNNGPAFHQTAGPRAHYTRRMQRNPLAA